MKLDLLLLLSLIYLESKLTFLKRSLNLGTKNERDDHDDECPFQL